MIVTSLNVCGTNNYMCFSSICRQHGNISIENPFLHFLHSLLPTFNPQVMFEFNTCTISFFLVELFISLSIVHTQDGQPAAGGDNPYQNPAARQLHDQLQRAAAGRNAQRAQQREHEEIPAGAEGNPGQPLDLQASLDRLFQVLQQVLGRGAPREGEEGSGEEED